MVALLSLLDPWGGGPIGATSTCCRYDASKMLWPCLSLGKSNSVCTRLAMCAIVPKPFCCTKAASSDNDGLTNNENSPFSMGYRKWTSGSGAAACKPMILLSNSFSSCSLPISNWWLRNVLKNLLSCTSYKEIRE